VNPYLSAVGLALGVGIGADVALAAADGPEVADFGHGLPDQSLLDQNQRTGGDGSLDLLLSQTGVDGRYSAQVIGLAHQFAVTVGQGRADLVLHVVGTELSDGSVQIGKGIGGDLRVCPNADKGRFAGRGIMDRLAVEGGADAGAEMTQPFRQGPGYGGFLIFSMIGVLVSMYAEFSLLFPESCMT